MRGNLVEEKIFTAKAPVTIGQSLRCSLSIPTDGMPAEHVLFALEEGRFVLRTTKHMDARLASKAGPIAVVAGDSSALVTEGGRGKITLGDATILFQEIATRVAPRPQLPASVRGSLSDRIDGRLALLVGGSIALHAGLAIWAWAQDSETDVLGKSTVAQAYHPDTVEFTMPDEPVKVVDPTTTGDQPTTPQPGVAKPVSPSQNVTPSGQQHIANQIPTDAQLHDQAVAMANLLADAGGHKTGTPGDMSNRNPTGDLHVQIQDARDHHVEIGNTTGGVRDSGIHVGTTTRPDGVPEIPGQIVTPIKTEDPKGGRIVITPIRTDEATTLTPDMIMSKIQNAYMLGLQRCYQKGLAQDASLAGKVSLAFTVNESGRVVDGSARGVGNGVDACISSQMAGWTFGIPRDSHKDPTDANFTLALQLTR